MAHAANLCPIDDIFNKSACIAETPVHTTYDAYDDSFLVSALLTARAASWQRARKLALEALGALVLSLDQAGIIPTREARLKISSGALPSNGQRAARSPFLRSRNCFIKRMDGRTDSDAVRHIDGRGQI